MTGLVIGLVLIAAMVLGAWWEMRRRRPVPDPEPTWGDPVREWVCGCVIGALHTCAAAADGRIPTTTHAGRRGVSTSALPPVEHDPDMELAELVDRFDGDGLDRLWRAVAAVQDDPGLTPDELATLVDAVDRHIATERGEVDRG